MKNLLIIRVGAVGDGLMLAPALASVRRAHPASYIEVAGIVWRLRMLAGPTLADAVRPLDDFFKDGEVLAHELSRFERIVTFSIDTEEPWVRKFADAAPGRVERYLSFPICRASEHHVIDHIQQALCRLGIEEKADRYYRLPVPPYASQFAEEFLAGVPSLGPRVYIQAGTKIATKRWPNARFIALCRNLVSERRCQIFLGCGPLDQQVVDDLEAGLTDVSFVRARGQDLVQTAGVLSKMDLCIGVDSGLTHLAGLVGTPTIAIYGPTRPQLWGPVGPKVHVLVGSRGLDCCLQDHPRICEGGCMEEVSPEKVFSTAADVLDGVVT